MHKKITIAKTSLRRLDSAVIKAQLIRIVNRMLAGGRGNKWSIRWALQPLDETPENYVYRCDLHIRRTGKKMAPEVLETQIVMMCHIGQAAGNAPGWEFPRQGDGTQMAVGDKAAPGDEQDAPAANGEGLEAAFAESDVTPFGEASPPAAPAPAYSDFRPRSDMGEHFAHIYERDAQIAIVNSALQAFLTSEYANRFHCVLFGEPACGKTEILRSFSRMLGANAVLELDATSTTKAGAERILLESESLPPVLVCEEIEKTDENSLRWLLGILDHRAEVRKVTHNRGMRQRNVKMLCLATVNDMALFKRVMDGALASRFSHKIYCPRPSKEVLRRILQREIAKVGGDESWVTPAIDWCVDTEGTNDPRRVITVCLSGREKLLTGEYQKLLAAVAEPSSKQAQWSRDQEAVARVQA